MFVDLVPEWIGLILTPAAIAGCILLLQSRHPYGNAVAFAAAFLVLYTVISLVVLAIGGTVEPSEDTATAKGVVGISIGGLFLLIGLVIALHHKQTREGPPHWATMLEQAQPTGAFMAGVVLAIANPNVFLLLSGLGIVADSATDRGHQVAGVVFLLTGVALDFMIPIVLFAVFGQRARGWLDAGKSWMIAHDRGLTLTILFGFGVLFAGRGIGNLL